MSNGWKAGETGQDFAAKGTTAPLARMAAKARDPVPDLNVYWAIAV
jgi:hypothetical protein